MSLPVKMKVSVKPTIIAVAVTTIMTVHAEEDISGELLEYLAAYEIIDGELTDPIEFAEGLEQMIQTSPTSHDKTAAEPPDADSDSNRKNSYSGDNGNE